MKKKITQFVLEKSCKEVYGVENDSCPICGKKFLVPGNIVKLGNIAYDLECYHNSTNQGIKIK